MKLKFSKPDTARFLWKNVGCFMSENYGETTYISSKDFTHRALPKGAHRLRYQGVAVRLLRLTPLKCLADEHLSGREISGLRVILAGGTDDHIADIHIRRLSHDEMDRICNIFSYQQRTEFVF